MTTTDSWREARLDGDACVHETSRWVLVRLDGPADQLAAGWYLFGRDASGGLRVDPGDPSPALNLLLASRTADVYIAACARSARKSGDGR